MTDKNECLTRIPIPILEPKHPKIELKMLPRNLRYEFLDSEFNRPFIVIADLGREETKKILVVLKRYLEVMRHTIDDLKGINCTVCMHKILLEKDSKPSREH